MSSGPLKPEIPKINKAARISEKQMMPPRGLPRQQADTGPQAVYIWRRIHPRGNRLIFDKIRLIDEELKQEFEKARAEIRFANRVNLNKTGVEIAVSEMWEEKVDSYVGKCYEVYCHHWNLLDEVKTSAFVRVVLDILLPHIEQLGRSAARAACRAHRRMGSIGTSLAGSYETSARRISDQWRTQLEIEARELDIRAGQTLRISGPPAAPTPHEMRKTPLRSQLDSRGLSLNNGAVQSGVDFHAANRFLKGQQYSERVKSRSRVVLSETDRGVQPWSQPTDFRIPRYRSPLKRAILMQFLTNPTASDVDICHGLDDDENINLPDDWKIRAEDRLFSQAYKYHKTKRRMQIAFSKIRVDLREKALLPPR